MRRRGQLRLLLSFLGGFLRVLVDQLGAPHVMQYQAGYDLAFLDVMVDWVLVRDADNDLSWNFSHLNKR